MSEKRPLSLYLHFPFCVRKCRYCDFLSFPAGLEERQEYVDLLCGEIRQRGPEFAACEVQTVFFGGGTPSLLEPGQLGCIMQALQESFLLAEDAEISLECNPGTADKDKLAAYRALGINRLSIGLQSADDRELALLGRIHTADQFRQVIQAAEEAGFDNINIDLMSAIPGQTIESFKKSLEKVLEMRPAHLSVYSLIIEEGTPFWQIYGEDDESDEKTDGMPSLPSEEDEREMVHLTEKMLTQAGYVHYEVSNYALPGRECRHNLVYWRRGEYLGVGLGAASLIGDMRFRNTSDPAAYRQDFCTREESEKLSRKAQMEETMFLGLRCLDGISIRDFEERFGCRIDSVYGDVISRYTDLGLLKMEDGRIMLTGRGMDVSNLILADFLL